MWTDNHNYFQTLQADLSKVNIWMICLFYLLAFVLAAPFNSGLLQEAYLKLTKGCMINNWPYLPAGLGTLFATITVLWLDKKHLKTITLFGNVPLKNLLIALIPLLVFTSIGLKNAPGKNGHYFAFVFMAMNFIYALAEEVGWRGYLQDALGNLHANLRYLFIGILWWAWHFRFHTAFELTIFPIICMGSAFLLGKFVAQTKSSVSAAGLHSLIIVLTNSGEITVSKIMGTLLCILAWLAIGRLWK